MGKVVFLVALLCITYVNSSGIINYLEGFAYGYGLSDTCKTSIQEIENVWITFTDSIETSDGSGNALYKFHDFTLGITQACTNCNFLSIASLFDSAFTTNWLATIIRLVANYASIYDAWNTMINAFKSADYALAGEQIGIIFKGLIG
ncbi:hypothetical protein SteCoe_33328 [Stentor coeruleus]|uniref:Uncharacterized protein n=1 Tax=Stentor coeruleus TaxID=5963 RepID=A0A1R2AX03_9CILI|nr:hypothetical protein SteCoe_33328 [Stentor coeruleus]